MEEFNVQELCNFTPKAYSETRNVYMFDLRGDFGGRNEKAGR